MVVSFRTILLGRRFRAGCGRLPDSCPPRCPGRAAAAPRCADGPALGYHRPADVLVGKSAVAPRLGPPMLDDCGGDLGDAPGGRQRGGRVEEPPPRPTRRLA